MLDVFRRYQQSLFIYLMFGLLIVIFAVNFGPGSGSCNPAAGNDYAAIVDGETIRREEYAMRLSRTVDSMRQRFAAAKAGNFDNEMIERMGIKKQIIDELVARKLLAQEARGRGLRITDDELVSYLQERYGVKDVTPEQYQGWVASVFGTSVDRFEAIIREEMLAQKLQTVLGEGVSVSDAELKATFLREHDRAMVTFVKLDPETITVPEPTAAAIDALLAEDMKTIEERYNRDVFKYRTPQQIRARQILKTLAPDASDAEVARVRGQLLELKAQLEGGADFAALAAEHSDDEGTKQKGGDLGLFSRGHMQKAIEDAAFALKPNEITAEPVRSPRGLHLIQMTENKPAARKELAEVKRDVAIAVLQEREQEKLALAQADALRAKLEGGAAIETLTWTDQEARDAAEKGDVKEKRPVRADTPWILKSQEAIPRIGASKELHDEIFALTTDAPLARQAHKVGRSFFVVRLKERETPDLAKFEETKESLRDQAVSMKRNQVLEDWVDHLRKEKTVQLNPALFGAPEAAAPKAG